MKRIRTLRNYEGTALISQGGNFVTSGRADLVLEEEVPEGVSEGGLKQWYGQFIGDDLDLLANPHGEWEIKIEGKTASIIITSTTIGIGANSAELLGNGPCQF